MSHPYKVIHSEKHHIGRFSIIKDTLEINSCQYPFSYIDAGRSVTVLPVFNGKIAVINQYRHSLDEWVLEFPAGGVEKNEKAETAAARELLEETGLIADCIKHIGECYASEGMSSGIVDLFVAYCSRREKNHAEPTEFIRQEEYSIDEMEHLIMTNQFKFSGGIMIWHLAKDKIVKAVEDSEKL